MLVRTDRDGIYPRETRTHVNNQMKQNTETYTPTQWVLIKIPSGDYKVFATWIGGYLDDDSWRTNSGISRVEDEDDHFLVYGYSGSVYKCRKSSYGTTTYGAAVLSCVSTKDGSFQVLRHYSECPLFKKQ